MGSATNFFLSGGLSGPVGGSSEYGSKPIVPKAIDYSEALEKIIAENARLGPSMQAFFEAAMPGYAAGRAGIQSVIQSRLKGELTQAETTGIEQDAANYGISSGVFGSDFLKNRNVLGRALTRHAVISEGLDSAMRWLSQGEQTTSRFFLGKEEAVRQTEFNWQRDWLAAQVKAAPNPVARGQMDSELAIGGMVLGVYGGAGYQQRYQPSYQAPQSTSGAVTGANAGANAGYSGGAPTINYNINSSPGGSGYSQDFYDYGPQ